MNLLKRRPASFEMLADADFRRYFVADLPFEAGATARRVAMGWAALSLTGSQFWVGLVTGLPGLTLALCGLAAGVVVDRYDRRMLLILVRAAFVALSLPLWALALSGALEPWHLLVATLGVGAVRALSLPALRAFLTDLVGRERLLSANSLTGASSSAGELVGPLLAGLAVATFGVESGFLITAIAYGTCALMLLRVKSRPALDVPRGEPLLGQLYDGVRYAVKTPPLLALVVVAATQFPAGMITPLVPVYAREVLDVGAAGYGVMEAFLGVGFLVGALITSSIPDFGKKGLVLLVTALCWDAGALAFGFSRSFPLSVGMLFVMGVAGAIHVIFLLTMFQQVASDRMQGRVLSIYGMLTAFFPLGFILGGWLASTFGNEAAIVMGAAVSTPVMLAAYALSPGLRAK